jgi:hypothetical protein
MVKEMVALDKNEAKDQVVLLVGKNPIGSKCVFKNKLNAKGKVEKYNSCLVENGYSQVEGIYFGEIFSANAKLNSIIFLLSVATDFDLEVQYMDVKTTFLYGYIEEEIYMKQQEGFEVKGKKQPVCKMEKVPVLKQSTSMGIKSLILIFWDLISQGENLITVCILN